MSEAADACNTLFEYLRQVIYSPDGAHLDIGLLPPEFRELGEGLSYLAECHEEERTFALALAKGDFDAQPPGRENALAGPLKTLHNSLKHLTWQTQQVAKGDYGQRLDFMGDFAAAFNTMVRQLEERKEAMERNAEELRSIAFHDSQTGLYNRNYAIKLMERWGEENKAFLIAYVDIDNVQLVNDILGHEVGDEYIVATGNILRELPGEPIICRMSGDEFIIFTTGLARPVLEKELARLRDRLTQHVDGFSGRNYHRSFSFGTVIVPANATSSINTLLGLARSRMTQYKIANKAARFKKPKPEDEAADGAPADTSLT